MQMTSTRSGSTSWATAAPPASGTGPAAPPVQKAVLDNDLAVCSVLSGNRNFEARINPDVKMNYLALAAPCVAYALAGRMDADLTSEPLGDGADGEPVYLRDIWPSQSEIQQAIETAIESDMYRKSYGEVFEGDETWKELPAPGATAWDEQSTYVKQPPYFEGMPPEAPEGFDRIEARVIAPSGTASRRTTSRRQGRSRTHRWPLPDRPRRAEGLQLLRLAAGQPRGDDARHLRQRGCATCSHPTRRAGSTSSCPRASRRRFRGGDGVRR